MSVDRPLIRRELKDSGQWEAFCVLRDRMKSKGMSVDDSWQLAYEDLTGSPRSVVDDSCEDIVDIVDIVDTGVPPVPRPGVVDLLGETRDMSAIVNWVFDNIDNAHVTRSQAPTPGAWSWLEGVRSDPDTRRDFYARHVTKMIKPVSEDEDVRQFEDDGRSCRLTIEEIQKAVIESERMHA